MALSKKKKKAAVKAGGSALLPWGPRRGAARNQRARAAGVAGRVFWRGLVAARSFRISRQRACAAALRRSRLRLGLGLRDVRVVRPSRGPGASGACPGHPRSRAAQVVSAPGILPHRAAPRRSPSLLGRNPDPTPRAGVRFSEILPGSPQNSGLTHTPGSSARTPRPWDCLPRDTAPRYPGLWPCSPRSWGIRTLGNPAVLPPLARRRETQGPLTSWTPREPRPITSQNAL